MSTAAALDAAHAAMAAQRAALINGDYAALPSLARRLERDLSALSAPISLDSLRRLRADAARVATLIRAAQDGLGQARAQLDAPKDAGFDTYDAQGRKAVAAPGAGRTLSRR